MTRKKDPGLAKNSELVEIVATTFFMNPLLGIRTGLVFSVNRIGEGFRHVYFHARGVHHDKLKADYEEDDEEDLFHKYVRV